MIFTLFLAFVLAFSNSFGYAAVHGLQQEIEQFLQTEPNVQGALVGISVRSATTGDILYEHNGDIRMKPASNLKLLTAAAGLTVGEPAKLKQIPKTNYVNITNETITTSPDSKTELTIEREHGSNNIKISGFLPLKAKPKQK